MSWNSFFSSWCPAALSLRMGCGSTTSLPSFMRGITKPVTPFFLAIQTLWSAGPQNWFTVWRTSGGSVANQRW
ncbi:hypothetical protein Y695_02704 [Hydrogenophaga sp. T4]|nr:hypothetical protein Y695_02704 [Hydrogenophaga sp. T4]